MRIKRSKRNKITCLTFYAFYPFYAFYVFYAFYYFYACEITPNNLIYYTTSVNNKLLMKTCFLSNRKEDSVNNMKTCLKSHFVKHK